MIAYCGINCDNCPAYIGTINGDHEQLDKMIELYGSAKTDRVYFVCLGCKYPDLKLLATDCADCPILSCARQRGLDFCAICDEFITCEKIKPLKGDGSLVRDRMNALLRAKYLRETNR